MIELNAKKMLQHARKFTLLERKKSKIFHPEVSVEWRGENSWVVRVDNMDCLNSCGELEWEPSPSGRDENFLSRTRFSLEDAWSLAEKYIESLGLKTNV